jgi:biotin carboxyl carrier protein
VRLDATVDGRTFRVQVRQEGDGYEVTVDGVSLKFDLAEISGSFASLIVGGLSLDVGLEKRSDGYRVHLSDETYTVALAEASRDGARAVRQADGPTRLAAPMPGRVVKVLVEEGQEVVAGEGLVVIEAMKMENELKASRGGSVRKVAVHQGQAVEAGALLVVVA